MKVVKLIDILNKFVEQHGTNLEMELGWWADRGYNRVFELYPLNEDRIQIASDCSTVYIEENDY